FWKLYSTLGKSGHRAPHWSLMLPAIFFGQSAVISSSQNHLSLDSKGKLPILFSLAVSYQQRPIVFPLPLEFYLQKISINRLYAVIRFHSLALSPAWYRPAEQHRLPCPLL